MGVTIYQMRKRRHRNLNVLFNYYKPQIKTKAKIIYRTLTSFKYPQEVVQLLKDDNTSHKQKDVSHEYRKLLHEKE